MRALTRVSNLIEVPRTSLTSGRLLASLCQHFSATFQTALEVPGASKSRGFCGRLPLETMGGISGWILFDRIRPSCESEAYSGTE